MISDSDIDILARTAARAARGPAPLLAALVAAWRHAFPDRNPVDTLACTEQTLLELSLCLRPRPGSWLADATDISQALHIDTDRLVAFLRAAESVERFSVAHPANQSQSGRLLAARDHDSEDNEDL
jgi:hypothetical protein